MSGKIISYGEDKWNGKFTWLWTFVSGDEGFISFSMADLEDTEKGKFSFSGIFYLLGKIDNQWSVKYQVELENESEDMNTTYLPKASNDLKSAVDGEYWGLVENEDKWKKLCKHSDCGASSKSKFINKRLSFEKGSDPAQKPKEWSVDMNWWNALYSDIGLPLINRTDSFTGKWELTK